MAMRGWVFPYSEQGWEGAVVWAFQDSAYAASRLAGWDPNGLYWLQRGDRLKIFDDDGALLWQGVIEPVARINLVKRVTPGDGDWFPKGVPLETWREWMWRHPPYAAELERA